MERPMSVSTLTHIALGLLALVGAAAIAAALMLASPVRPPPTLASIHEGAMPIDPVRALPGRRRHLARLPARSGGQRSARPDRDSGPRLFGQFDRDGSHRDGAR